MSPKLPFREQIGTFAQVTCVNTEMMDPREPYNNLPPLPPRAEIETPRTLKRAIAARGAIAELKGVGELIPNQAILIRAIILQEAKLSSEIENIVTTNDLLYRAFSDEAKTFDPNTKEVLRYEHALWHGYNHLKQGKVLSATLFVEMVRILRMADINIRTMPGTQIINDRTKKVVYTPPVGETLIRNLLDNLSDFLYAEDDVEPLIKLAVMHYQFESIHPFSDGNGRTGRVLNILYLVKAGLIEIPVLYLSRYIIQHKSDYYKGLRRVTEEAAWEDWICYMLDAVHDTAQNTKNRILGIRTALLAAIERAKTGARCYSKELIELIFQQPYTRIQFVESALGVRRQAASRYLQELESIGLIKGHRTGREVLYVNAELLRILSEP